MISDAPIGRRVQFASLFAPYALSETPKGDLMGRPPRLHIRVTHPSARARFTSGGTASSVSSASTSVKGFTVLA